MRASHRWHSPTPQPNMRLILDQFEQLIPKKMRSRANFSDDVFGCPEHTFLPTDLLCPIVVVPYYDRLKIWFLNELTSAQPHRLGRFCNGGMSNLKPSKSGIHANKCGYDLFQPSSAALNYLLRLPEGDVAYAEIANDLGFKTLSEVYIANGQFRRDFFKAKQTTYPVVSGTITYFDPEESRVVFVVYPDDKYRLKKEHPNLHFLHLEYRFKDAFVLKRIEIKSTHDLASFSFTKFWRKRLTFKRPKLQTLGRRLSNSLTGSSRKHSIKCTQCKSWKFADARAGNVVSRLIGSRESEIRFKMVNYFYSTTAVWLALRDVIDLRPCFKPVDAERWLPPYND